MKLRESDRSSSRPGAWQIQIFNSCGSDAVIESSLCQPGQAIVHSYGIRY